MTDLPTGPSKPTDYDRVRVKQDAERDAAARVRKDMFERMEPNCDRNAAASQAISLKRIADSMDYIVTRHKQGEL